MRATILGMLWGLLCALVPLAAGEYAQQQKIAIMGLEGSQLDEETLNLLTEVISTELSSTGHYEVMSQRDVMAVVGYEAQKQLLGCDEAACMADIGGALGADMILQSQIGKIGETYVVNLKLIDVKAFKTVGRASDRVKGEIDGVLDAIRAGVRSLVATQRGETVGMRAPGLWSYSLWGGAAVALGVGTYFGLKARRHQENAEDPNYLGAQNEIGKGESAQLVANIAFGLGAVAAAAGTALWLIPTSSVTTSTHVGSSAATGFILGGEF